MENADKVINMKSIPLSTATIQQYREAAGREFMVEKHSQQYSHIVAFFAGLPLAPLAKNVLSLELSIFWCFVLCAVLVHSVFSHAMKSMVSNRLSDEQLVKALFPRSTDIERLR
jgi:hypothetical protein